MVQLDTETEAENQTKVLQYPKAAAMLALLPIFSTKTWRAVNLRNRKWTNEWFKLKHLWTISVCRIQETIVPRRCLFSSTLGMFYTGEVYFVLFFLFFGGGEMGVHICIVQCYYLIFYVTSARFLIGSVT